MWGHRFGMALRELCSRGTHGTDSRSSATHAGNPKAAGCEGMFATPQLRVADEGQQRMLPASELTMHATQRREHDSGHGVMTIMIRALLSTV